MSYEQRLRLASRLTLPATRQAIASLPVAPGSRGLDAGCGIGQHAIRLAKMVGADGSVTGLDINAQLLEVAKSDALKKLGPDRVWFRQGDMEHMPFDDSTFDWAICADALWTVPLAQAGKAIAASALDELRRVVKPGGWVALLYWSAQSFLPGYPELEARLGVAYTKINPYLCGIGPGQHYLGALGWLRAAGMGRTEARCYVVDVHAPLEQEMRSSLAMCFDMFWGEVEPHVTREDWAQYQRLCSPDSSEFIADRDDYFGFVVYTVFCGKVPG